MLAGLVTLGVMWFRSDAPPGTTPTVASIPATDADSEAQVGGPPPDEGVPETTTSRLPARARLAPGGSPQVSSPEQVSENLRVRVLDLAGRPVLKGEVVSYWGDSTHSLGRYRGTVAIHGDLTDVPVPEGARETVLGVSVRGTPPSPYQRVVLPLDPSAVIELVVGESLPPPCVVGRVRVDGVARLPLDLVIQLITQDQENVHTASFARINQLSGRYAAGRLAGRSVLWVTSAETAPITLLVPSFDAAAALEFDLELEAARSLRVTVLDHETGAAQVAFPVECRLLVKSEPGIRQMTYRPHLLYGRTDKEGRCTLRGIPREGTLQIRREGS